MIKLHSKPIRVNKSAADRKSLDVGANLFIGAQRCPCRSAASGASAHFVNFAVVGMRCILCVL